MIEGDSLSDRIKFGPIPVEEALKRALQMAEALEAAHKNGVIHRDLKPANIKVTPNGKVKILDFGLAKAYAGEEGNDLHIPPPIKGVLINFNSIQSISNHLEIRKKRIP